MTARAALCLVALSALAAASPARRSFRARIDIVQVTVTVIDADGRLVTGLTRDDFEIFEDGTAQPITQFTDERVPVSVGVLLDASDSMRGQPIVDARGARRSLRRRPARTRRRGVRRHLQPHAAAGRALDAAAVGAARRVVQPEAVRRHRASTTRWSRWRQHVRAAGAHAGGAGGHLRRRRHRQRPLAAAGASMQFAAATRSSTPLPSTNHRRAGQHARESGRAARDHRH